MKFLSTFVATLALGVATVEAIPSATALCDVIRALTTKSDNLRKEVIEINLINAPLRGWRIAKGFSGIVADITVAVPLLTTPNVRILTDPNIRSNVFAQMRKRYESADALEKRQLPLYSSADAKIIAVVLTDFVRVHQALLNVVIGKRGLLTLVPFAEPIRLALVSLEAIVDVSLSCSLNIV